MRAITIPPWHHYGDDVGAIATYGLLRGACDRAELRCLGLRPRPLAR